MAEERSRGLHRRSNGELNPASIDRISDLPDSIICHILSFLKTKFSVRTSILAKRWRYLWSYVPNLHFESENQDIINRVLLLLKLQNINSFRLTPLIDCNSYQVYTWITFAVERNVRNLDIDLDLDLDLNVDLPPCLFSCKNLVYLRLVNCGVIPDIDTVVRLPCLKKLHLIHVQYESDESLPHLISSCSMLEELLIHLFVDTYPCIISSPTIKSLTINLRSDGEGSDKRLEIDTPALVYLDLFDCSTQYIKCGALASLVEADIDIFPDTKPRDDLLFSRSVVEFIDKLRNVKCLKLDLADCPEIIDSIFTTWKGISFHNLTKLELSADGCFLPKFLEIADNLQILIFSKVRNEIKGWTEPRQVPACLLSHLRTIRLVYVVGKEHMFEMIRYLLKNALVLERMQIVYSNLLDSEEKTDMIQEVTRFRRGSKECEVDFISNHVYIQQKLS